ncbi:MAPEG family protein [Ciceribacter sp. L1K23]|uniref:MAPEG family protein n=1 Tax=unclassified Ciceribacter TaxID=2628820 RepID=UPI001ABDE9CF|nr:MAPEG family protein [Ciceribacter sp. L1K22]MBR0556670.1 MAPEG family protein [Ciceribacter sp. L1K23]
MVFTVTPLYALPVAAIYLILWVRVSAMRSATHVSFGDGGNIDLLRRIRQHGNCAEWTTFVLILMILAEGIGSSSLWLHICGTLLLIGRAAHPFGMLADNAGDPLRYVGNGTNMLAAIIAMVCIGAAVPAMLNG